MPVKIVSENRKSANSFLPYLKLLLNHPEFRKILKMNKFLNFLTNPTVYHMHHLLYIKSKLRAHQKKENYSRKSHNN
jgi:hypothetical protein